MKTRKLCALMTAAVLCVSCIATTSMMASAAEESSEESFYLEVFDKNTAWNQKTQIDLFKRNELGNQLVYPGVTGNYSFTVKNKTVSERNAEVVIEDTNEFNIPLDIRIKRDGKYILGSDTEWVDSANYDSGIYAIAASGESVYDLEWKWDFYEGEEQDSRDTELGVGAHYKNEPYNLAITVYGDGPDFEQSEPEPEPSPNPPDGSTDGDPSIPSRDDHTGIADNSPPDVDPDHNTVLTGDQTMALVMGIFGVMAVSAGVILVAVNKKKGDDGDDD